MWETADTFPEVHSKPSGSDKENMVSESQLALTAQDGRSRRDLIVASFSFYIEVLYPPTENLLVTWKNLLLHAQAGYQLCRGCSSIRRMNWVSNRAAYDPFAIGKHRMDSRFRKPQLDNVYIP